MFRFGRSAGAILCLAVIFLQSGAAQSAKRTVALRDLVQPSDPLSAHSLVFDATFAGQAVEYLDSKDGGLASRMVESAAVAHILAHATNFDYDVPKDSAQALVASLLGPEAKHAERRATCEQSIAYFTGPMLRDPHWVGDVLRYLPADFRFNGTLFLTFGYDIGVAFRQNASLNCTHAHFKNQQELLYYAIHELHHTGYMSYQTPPKLADIKSCADLLKLVEYSTQLEGMAVLAAYKRRSDDKALADDADYASLQDAAAMEADEASYFNDYNYLKSRGTEPVDAEAWAVIDRMSSGHRLWYRVGARMAHRIEDAKGRAVLTELVRQGPQAFIATYRSLPSPQTRPSRPPAASSAKRCR
jgi:hypothetical protein